LKKGLYGAGFIEEDGILIGVATGFDYATEHECGIRVLQESAGITTVNKLKPKKKWFGLKTEDPDFGLDRTTIKNPDRITQGIAETEDGTTYYVFGYNLFIKIPSFDFSGDFCALWREDSLVIASTDKERMTQITKAAYDGDLAFATGGKVLEDHAGIRLLIKSRCKPDLIEKCAKDDREYYELRQLHNKIGIDRKVRKAGCEFYACSPKWKDYDKKEIHWWLNPMDQRNIEAGFFTYDELIQWTEGKGPVFKKKKDKKEEIKW
jgi:hypothetical protein